MREEDLRVRAEPLKGASSCWRHFPCRLARMFRIAENNQRQQ